MGKQREEKAKEETVEGSKGANESERVSLKGVKRKRRRSEAKDYKKDRSPPR